MKNILIRPALSFISESSFLHRGRQGYPNPVQSLEYIRKCTASRSLTASKNRPTTFPSPHLGQLDISQAFLVRLLKSFPE